MSHPKLPGGGNRFLTTWRFMKDPYTSYRSWQQKFGDTFWIRALNGDIVVNANRENIRRIFAAPTESLSQFAVQTLKPLMGASSLFLVEGQTHRRERAMLSPSFHGDRIDGQAEIIREAAIRAGQSWQPGQTVEMMEPALELSLEVIIRIVFGIKSQAQVESFKKSIKHFVASFHPVLAFSRLTHRSLLGLSPWNRFVKSRDEFHQLIHQEIQSRRKTEKLGEDLLSRLLQARYDDDGSVSDQQICDHLVTMLLAGHETTQIAMAWAMSWLHRNPSMLGRLREELSNKNSSEQILKNEYLNGVCNESLRINAIVSDVVRKLKRPLELEDHLLPEGTNVSVAICLVHEDPELYPEPFRFMPQRWEGQRFKPHEFMPFGGGIRRCIGATLAMLELKMTIATWVEHFEFELPENIPDVEPVYRRNVTMAPKTGIPLVFKRRL